MARRWEREDKGRCRGEGRGRTKRGEKGGTRRKVLLMIVPGGRKRERGRKKKGGKEEKDEDREVQPTYR